MFNRRAGCQQIQTLRSPATYSGDIFCPRFSERVARLTFWANDGFNAMVGSPGVPARQLSDPHSLMGWLLLGKRSEKSQAGGWAALVSEARRWGQIYWESA